MILRESALRWEASFSAIERIMNRFLPLFARWNPPHAYTRQQVEAWIRHTPFRRGEVEEEGTEMKIKLRKPFGEPGEQT